MNNTTCTTIDTLRQPKIFNMAIFDWIATLAIIYAIAYYSQPSSTNFWTYYITLCFIGILCAIFIHWYLDIPTMFNYYLGINTKESVIKNRKNCS